MKYALMACIFISGCTSQPVTVVERVNVPTYIPIPSTLIAPVSVTFPLGVTYGEALGLQRQSLDTCNGQLKAIQGLAPPQ